ncbi:hypothetical protein [Rubinisphaera italica]|uniref:Uncharacterized protein n=1 Tax=Rubinisphaera italica TaxID=2527969 RepID=A0A5C5XIJ3_9PLAN|nr:hypothetical protein [Rubinisphaera italica]TWT61652.1 hypothetical protein Pan54_23890 [Rubinisphaera italica]
MANKTPEKTFRIGLVSASVFINEVDRDGGTRQIRNVNLQRRYRDGDNWKSSSSFGLADLPNALRALQLAMQHVESIEAESHS